MFSKADAYERFMGRWSRLLAPRLLAFAEPRDGETVLDVGSGTGILSFAVHDALPHAHILGVDPASDYVAFAAAQRGSDRVRFAVGDARSLELASASFDRTLSMLVMSFVPEPARAVTEMMRVTKPGGAVVAAVWDYPEQMQMLRVFWDEAIAHGPDAESRDEAHMQLCRQGELAALWSQQGLDSVDEQPLMIDLHFASFADYWEPFLLGQGPAGAYVATLAQERRAALANRLRERLLGERGDGPIEMQARAWAVKGVVPH